MNSLVLIYSNKLLVGALALIFVVSSSASVLGEGDFTQEQIDTGRYSIADPTGLGVGEGVSADATSEIPKQYSENTREQSSSVALANVEASVLNGCNCVVFRMDDLQDFFVNTVQKAMMDEFTLRNEFLSIGPVFALFGADPTVVDPAVTGYSSGLFEVFGHGWIHNDFSLESLAIQRSHLQLSQDKAELIFGSDTTFFVPPFNEFNNSTLDAMVATDFETISSSGDLDLDPHFVADGTSTIVDSRGLYHLPSDVELIDFDATPPARISNTQILADIDTSIATRGYAVVTVHAQNYAQTFPNGTFINAQNVTLMNDLREIIETVNLKNYPIRTFGQVIAFNDLDSDGILNTIDAENIINSSITIIHSHTVGNITVKNGAVLTIPNGLSITISSGSNLTIETGGGVLIESGGILQVNS